MRRTVSNTSAPEANSDKLATELFARGIKSVLLTCIYVRGYGGSQNVTLDIAKILKRRGIRVDAVTNSMGPPMEAEFRKIGVNLVSIDEVNWDARLSENYDLLFGFHWPVFGAVLYCSTIRFRHVVLASLSHFERVEILSVGVECADLLVFGTALNAETQLSSLLIEKQHDFLPNSLPEEWFRPVSMPPEPARIAIVSNHPPEELLHARDLLLDAGLNVLTVGMSSEAILVDSDFVDSLSAVITIGLTVPKSLSRGRGVFLYDRFGGVGWLQKDDAAYLEQENYSCRGVGRRWSPEKIATSFLTGFSLAQSLSAEYRSIADERYRLENHFARILKRLPDRSIYDVSMYRNKQSAAIMAEYISKAHPISIDSARPYVDERYNFSRSTQIQYLNSPSVRYKDIVVDDIIDIHPGSNPLDIFGNVVLADNKTVDAVVISRSDGGEFFAIPNQPSPWLRDKIGGDHSFENAFFSGKVFIEHDISWLVVSVITEGERVDLFRVELANMVGEYA